MSFTADTTVVERPKKRASKVASPKQAAVQTPEERAENHERRVKEQMDAQFQQLKDQAHALYGMVEGRPGVRSREEWEKLLDKAGAWRPPARGIRPAVLVMPRGRCIS